MFDKITKDSKKAARILTPDVEHTAAALRSKPNFVALRLQFRYEISHETTPRQQPDIIETLGFLFPAEVKEERLVQAMETALRAGGGQYFQPMVLPRRGDSSMCSAGSVQRLWCQSDRGNTARGPLGAKPVALKSLPRGPARSVLMPQMPEVLWGGAASKRCKEPSRLCTD